MNAWPTAIDLFAGAGGLSVGLRSARFQLIGAVENDPLAVESYKANFPRVHIWPNDIRGLSAREVMCQLDISEGDLGLLAGCPPCQGFSTIRTRRGRTVRDTRNALIDDYIRFVKALRPRALIMENVPGVAAYERFKNARRDLSRLGYKTSWSIFNAADFGVPQRRKRLILVGTNQGVQEIELQLGYEPIETLTVREAIGSLPLPGLSGDPLHDLVERRSSRVQSIIQRIPVDGGSRSALEGDQLACHHRNNGFKDVYGRMAWDEVAPTITGGCVNPSKGRFLHPEQNRAITVREALILQGFPSSYQLSMRRGKYAAAQLVGNAIPPPMVAAHASKIRKHLVEPEGSA